MLNTGPPARWRIHREACHAFLSWPALFVSTATSVFDFFIRRIQHGQVFHRMVAGRAGGLAAAGVCVHPLVLMGTPMTNPWLARTAASGAAASAQLAQASDALAAKLHDVGHALARHGEHGLDLARTGSDEIAASLRRAGRSTRGLVVERPIESVLIVAALGIAIGWILRLSREKRNDIEGRTRAAPARSRGKRTGRRASTLSE
ncbi:MAG: hypothetical protein ABI843_10260 [Dokdonella sp.]